MALPRAWIDKIFAKLSLTYGGAFLRQWQDFDIDAVKDDWAETLAGFQPYPEMLAYALENLHSSKPPTVLEFRDIARKMPARPEPKLPPPQVDREKAHEMMKLALSKLKRIPCAD